MKSEYVKFAEGDCEVDIEGDVRCARCNGVLSMNEKVLIRVKPASTNEFLIAILLHEHCAK